MTRFDADAPEDRRKLFTEGIVAHRERGSPFVTFEAHVDAGRADAFSGDGDDEGDSDDGGDGGESDDDESGEIADETAGEAPEEVPPWVQFGDGTLNLDCTDAELDDLKDLLGEFPAFKIDEITRPEEAEGINVRVSALADPNRVSQCVERIFREVYDQPEDFRAWVTTV